MWRPLAARWPLRRLTVPHVCDFGHEVGMKPSAVRYAREVRWLLRCPVQGCDGYLWPATTTRPAQGHALRVAFAAEGERPENRQAAPGGTPARPTKPNDCEESRDMHTLLMEKTPRGRQMTAALALAHLLEAGLPDAEWRITADGRLCGHVNLPGRDVQARADIASYAEFLGAVTVPEPNTGQHATWTHLGTSGLYRGTRVSVWTHVDVRPLDGSQA